MILYGASYESSGQYFQVKLLVNLLPSKTSTILDFFAGSGTTGVACKLEDRFFLGIEHEKEYVEIARNRIKSA